MSKSRLFDADADYIEIADSTSLQLMQNFTIAFWGKILGNTGILITKTTGANAGAGLYKGSASVLSLYAEGVLKAYFTDTPYLNTWHFFCFTGDSIRTSIYVDGALILLNGAKINSSFWNIAAPIRIGAPNYNFYIGTQSFKGRLAHLQIFNRALTLAEMILIQTTPGIVRSGLVSWLKMEGPNQNKERDFATPGTFHTVSSALIDSDGPTVSEFDGAPTPSYSVDVPFKISRSLFKDDIGVRILVRFMNGTTPVDISDSTTKTIRIKKPSGVITEIPAIFLTDGTDGILQYFTISGDLDVSGVYMIQGYISDGVESFYSEFVSIIVGEKIAL